MKSIIQNEKIMIWNNRDFKIKQNDNKFDWKIKIKKISNEKLL